MMHLGYEPDDLERSVAGQDVAHAYFRRVPPNTRPTALCGTELGTTFDLLLFGTESPVLPSGVEKCAECLRIAREAGVE